MTRQLVDVTFSLPGAIRADQETGAFVSYCPALDLYSAGRTRPDARQALRSAVDLFVRVCYERGILDRVLKAKGFAILSGGGVAAVAPSPSGDHITIAEVEPATDFDDYFSVDVPMHLVATQDPLGCPP